jgi:hypothetical protein
MPFRPNPDNRVQANYGRRHIPRMVRYLVFVSPLILAACVSPDDRARAVEDVASDDPVRRLVGLDILRRCDDSDAHALVRALARDREPLVRGLAIEAVGNYRDRDAVPLLLDALSDEGEWKHCRRHFLAFCEYKEKFAQTAHEALVRITGYHVPFDARASKTERDRAIAEWRSKCRGWMKNTEGPESESGDAIQIP